jgi:hypothetical protein
VVGEELVLPEIPDQGWRQGSVIPHHQERGVSASSLEGLTLNRPLEADDLLILISQDCDIVCPSYDNEPYVELLVARAVPQDKRDGTLFHGKNPRRLQFQMEAAEGHLLYEVNIHEKSRLDRKSLVGVEAAAGPRPDASVVDVLTKWTAKRYTRAAFPTNFNERCRPVMGRIGRKLKARGDLLTGIFLRLDTLEELPAGEDYRVILRVTARSEDLEDIDNNDAAIALITDIEIALNECEGIDVVDAALVPEDDFTLADLREVRRWDYDYLSFGADEPELIAPEA